MIMICRHVSIVDKEKKMKINEKYNDSMKVKRTLRFTTWREKLKNWTKIIWCKKLKWKKMELRMVKIEIDENDVNRVVWDIKTWRWCYSHIEKKKKIAELCGKIWKYVWDYPWLKTSVKKMRGAISLKKKIKI